MVCAGTVSVLVCLLTAVRAAVDEFTIYTDAIRLRPGEVHNRAPPPVPLPATLVRRFANRSIAVVGYDMDIVRRNGTEETSIPLSEVYNHHYSLVLGTNETVQKAYQQFSQHDPLNPNVHKSCFGGVHSKTLLASKDSTYLAFGGGSGAEFRHTSYDLASPFRFVLKSPESFVALLHFIDTKGLAGKRLLECPCTSARHINVTNGTIDGYRPLPFHCTQELMEQHNTACSLATYEGGYRCCEHGVFLTEHPDYDAPVDEVVVKFRVRFEDVSPATRATSTTACCDVTGDLEQPGNIEYDIPKCDPASGSECVHVATTVQTVDMFPDAGHNYIHATHAGSPDDLIDIVYAYGHQHVGGLGMELFDDRTGELLCTSLPRYGGGQAPGDEAGYVVGFSSCTWGPPPLQPPPRMRRADKLRVVARYNSTRAHHGVMSLWVMQKSDVHSATAAVLI